MNSFRMRFIVGISELELHALKKGEQVISKMLLPPDDFSVFHYDEGDFIEAETPKGDRLWTKIRHLEIVEDTYRTIIILSLINDQ